MKAPVYWLGLVLCCSACTAPSLRYKNEVNKLVVAEQFTQAAQQVEKHRRKSYAKKDFALAYLDEAALLHDAGQTTQSDALLALAQARTEELYTKRVGAETARLLVNDLTAAYYPAPYEQALTYFYRAMNFLERQDWAGAAVEARRAAFYLDHLRGEKQHGYNDDPFVQYFTALIFEAIHQPDDARISRTNALNAYAKWGSDWKISAPVFSIPENANELGEVIIFHYNGLLPLKKTQTMQLAWSRMHGILATYNEDRSALTPQVQNALNAGFMGNSITVAYPVLEKQSYYITSSAIEINGEQYPLQKVTNLAALSKQDLDEKMPGILFRVVARGVAKQVAAAQARQLATGSSKDDTMGDVAGWFVQVLGAATERADTRQWFTLPAEIHMQRLFLPPSVQNIKMLFKDGNGNIVGEHIFENVTIERGKRVFLHYRTAR